MGLTTWQNAPAGPVRKRDVSVAKNYLTSEELSELNRIVSMYLDFAEDRARRGKPMHMADWSSRLDAFLQFNERNILLHAGTISHELAAQHAHGEFEQFDKRQIAAPGADSFDELSRHVDQVASPVKDEERH